jgi:dihydroneopterin aldolase
VDKIFVRDFLKEVEIGAFQSERGCTQRVKFNVSLDLIPLSVEIDDDVDKIISYEIITDAINLELSMQRFNLLETLAEKVADRCLREPRAKRVEVKIEKLDRIPGSLGIQISRDKVADQKDIVKNAEEVDLSEIVLVSFSAEMTDCEEMKSWLFMFLESKKKVTILLDPQPQSFNKNMTEYAINQVILLGMEQEAWRNVCLDDRLTIVSTRAELFWATQSNKVTLFCPNNFTKNSVTVTPDLLNNYDDFLVRSLKELGLKQLCLIGRDNNKWTTNAENLTVNFFHKNDWKSF